MCPAGGGGGGVSDRKQREPCESLCCFSCSQGTNRYFQRVASNLGLEVSFADCTKPEQLKAALKPNTKVRRMDRIHTEMLSECLIDNCVLSNAVFPVLLGRDREATLLCCKIVV